MARSLARRLGCSLVLMSPASSFVGHSHHRIILSPSISARVNFSRRFTLRNLIHDGALGRVYEPGYAGTHVTLTDLRLVDKHKGFEMSKIMKRTKYIYTYGILYALLFLKFRIFDNHPTFVIFDCTIRLLVIVERFFSF